MTTHAPKARFDLWEPIARGAGLAAKVAKAAVEHHNKRMSAEDYRAFVTQVETQARHEDVESEYRAAIVKQLNAGAAAEAIHLFERILAEVNERCNLARAKESERRKELERAQEAFNMAGQERAAAEKRMDEIAIAIDKLVRG